MIPELVATTLLGFTKVVRDNPAMTQEALKFGIDTIVPLIQGPPRFQATQEELNEIVIELTRLRLKGGHGV